MDALRAGGQSIHDFWSDESDILNSLSIAVVVHRFYRALFSVLEQTHYALVVCGSE